MGVGGHAQHHGHLLEKRWKWAFEDCTNEALHKESSDDSIASEYITTKVLPKTSNGWLVSRGFAMRL